MFGFVKFSKGDKIIFDTLFNERITVLYKIAYSYFKDKEIASDAVQDTALIAYKNFHKLKERDKFNSWITTILVNRCREVMRKSKKINIESYEHSIIDLNALQHYEKSDYSRIEDKLYVIEAMKKLDVKYSEIVRLKYFGNCSIAEISQVLGIPEGTVKSRLNTAIKKLRSVLEVKDNVL